MPVERTCPECGGDLASDELQGLCPRCSPRCIGRFAFGGTSSLANASAKRDITAENRIPAETSGTSRGREADEGGDSVED